MAFDITEIKVSEGQRALATYIKTETGKVIKPETIAAVDALREAYRKDPARVAEREAQKEAARKRKLEAYEKAVAKAAALAKSLGIPGDFDVTPPFEPETLAEDNTETLEDDWADETPQPAVIEKPKRAAKKAAPKLAAVPDPEPTPNDEDTSAIVVAQADDTWESDGSEADEDFDDTVEDY